MTGEVTVRPARSQDDVAGVIRDAFADEADKLVPLWAELEASEQLLASLVAEVEGELVGHVGLSHAWLDARRELVEVCVLSPLGVVHRQQGRGIGTRLLVAAVETARASGTPQLFLEGDPGYYAARGFERADRFGFAPASVRTPAPAFQVVRLDAHVEWMTGRLIYPDIWWRHDAAGLRDPMLAEIEEKLR